MDGIQPEFPEPRRCFFKRGSVFVGGRAQALDRNPGMAQFAGVAHVPAFQAGSGDLGVKLQAEREVSDCKCLIRIEISLGQVKCPRRRIEGISMPMEKR